MTFCRESTCWFSSLILSSLAVWFIWTFLLLFSSEVFTSELFSEEALNDLSYKSKNIPKISCTFWYMSYVMPVPFHANVTKWSMLLFCTSEAPIVCCLMSISVDSQSADQVVDPLLNLKIKACVQFMNNVAMSFYDKEDIMCIMYQVPSVSFSVKRLLSSGIPNIFIQESIIFPIVVSIGVLRWTIRSDAATHDTTVRRNIEGLRNAFSFSARHILPFGHAPFVSYTRMHNWVWEKITGVWLGLGTK